MHLLRNPGECTCINISVENKLLICIFMLFITPFPSQVQNDNIHILVIDDEEEVLKATRDYLVSTFSFMVDTAGSGKEALEKISRNRYDAIIADYIMEDTNGISLLKTIRDDGDDTPVIIFTGKGREDVVIAAFENGADGYVMKGDEIRSQFVDLAKKINTLVQNRRMADSLLEAEGQFKNIYEDSPIAIELYNKDGILIDVNPAFCMLFGVHSPESVRGFSLFSDPQLPDKNLKQIKRGETTRFRTTFDFDLVKEKKLFETRREGKVMLDVQITPMIHGRHQVTGYLVHVTDITKEVQAQEELINQKLLLNRLLETIPSPVFYKDNSGRYMFFNNAFESFVGLTKEEIVGKTVRDFAPKSHADFYTENDIELLNTPKSVSYESRVRLSDGLLRDVIFSKATLLDQNDHIQGVIGIITDVSDIKKAEKEIREKEAYIRTILDNLPIGVAVNSMAPHIGFSYHNKNFLKIFRIPEAALMEPENIWDYIYEDPQLRDEMKRRALEDYASGDLSRMHWDDIPITRKGEEASYVSAMSIPIPSSNLLISTVWDVTARKNFEFELRKTNQILEGMLDGIPDIIGIQNPDHSLIRYNKAGYEILGLSHEEVAGKPCYSLIGRTKPCEICASTRSVQSKKIVTVEKYVPELKRHLICRSNPILDDDGNVQIVVEQLTDITSRKQMEEAINQTNQKLRFLTGLTRHDILNILNAIYYYHELALSDDDPEKSREYIMKAGEAANRIEATIGFTREYEDFGVASSGWQSVYSIIESAKREVNAGSIVISNYISPSLEVFVDPIIRKVFSTLLENAVRHGITITSIRFSAIEKDNDLVIVCEDDGVGIPVENKMQIFGMGYGNHTGIGLFLAREILSITGLSIKEVGEEGKGARFEILVPEGKWRE